VARRSTIRASDADRESVVERLRSAAGEGRIAAHELEHRVTVALKAKTYGDLDATVADLPAEREGGRRRSGGSRVLTTVREHPVLVVAALPILIAVVAVVLAVMILLLMAWATVTLFVVAITHDRRRIHGPGPRGRGPWMYTGSQHRLRSARNSAAGGFIPWL
jgi:DUF1707 SHOCT-like domain